jgi:hypothetical protein
MRNVTKMMGLGAVIALVGCSNPPNVLQGKVVSYDGEKKVLVVEDEALPHPQVTLDLKSAEVGGNPAPGNIVRVAYRDRGGNLVAGRVMNLTTQKKK